MNLARRRCLPLAAIAAWLLAGCGALPLALDPLVSHTLAPTGSLRVGVYPGSPTSLVQDPKTGARAGVALDLGRALAARLGVPVRVVEFMSLWAHYVAPVK